MEKKYKRRWGDKRDGRLIRGDELDTNHFIMPIVWPNRTDCEAFISETIDLTAVDRFIKEKNREATGSKYSLFALVLAALGKLFVNRPKMNRFYRNKRLYERYEISIGFIVKKSMTDDGAEALAKIIIDPEDTLDTVVEKVRKEVEFCRSEAMDKSSDELRILMKFPFFIGKLVLGFMKMVDRHTAVPKSVSESDIFFKSIAVTNLGSIRLDAAYHHLSNWGTNSFFVILGEKKRRMFYDSQGNGEMKDSIEIGMTIDERIADGFYFAKSIRMFKSYLEHPEVLELPFSSNGKADAVENKSINNGGENV